MSRRIALVVGTSTGGVGKHVLSLGTGLARRGHRVAVLGPAESDRALGFTEAGLRFFPVRIGASPAETDPTAVLKLAHRIPLLIYQTVYKALKLRTG